MSTQLAVFLMAQLGSVCAGALSVTHETCLLQRGSQLKQAGNTTHHEEEFDDDMGLLKEDDESEDEHEMGLMQLESGKGNLSAQNSESPHSIAARPSRHRRRTWNANRRRFTLKNLFHGGNCWSGIIPASTTFAGMPIPGSHNANAYSLSGEDHYRTCFVDNHYQNIESQGYSGIRFFDIDIRESDCRTVHNKRSYEKVWEILRQLDRAMSLCPHDVWFLQVGDKTGSREGAWKCVLSYLKEDMVAGNYKHLTGPDRLAMFNKCETTQMDDYFGTGTGHKILTDGGGVRTNDWWRNEAYGGDLKGRLVLTSASHSQRCGVKSVWDKYFYSYYMRFGKYIDIGYYKEDLKFSFVVAGFFKKTMCGSKNMRRDRLNEAGNLWWEYYKKHDCGPTAILVDNANRGRMTVSDLVYGMIGCWHNWKDKSYCLPGLNR